MFCRSPILLAAPLLALAILACGDDDQGPTATPSATILPATPTDTTGVTTAPIPPLDASWESYTDLEGLFSLKYPPGWTQIGGAFYSYDPRSSSGPPEGLPDGVIKLEVGAAAIWGLSDCGPLELDQDTGQPIGDPQDAIETTLGGVPAYRFSTISSLDGSTPVYGAAAVHGDTCLAVIAYDTRDVADEAFFDDVLAGFEIHFTIPDEWPIHTTPDGLARIHYPPGWEPNDEGVYSAADDSTVQLSVSPVEGRAKCGEVLETSRTIIQDLHPDVFATTLDGVEAWGLDNELYGASPTRVLEVCALHAEHLIHLKVENVGYWTFEQMLHSVKLNY